jgi:zinc protease
MMGCWMQYLGRVCRARRPVLRLMLVGGFTGLVSVGTAMGAETLSLHIPSRKVTLPNGLTVVVSEKHKLPVVHINVRIRAGAAHDPEDKAGLADLTARLLNKGTMQRTASDIADEVDFLGARLDASAGGTGSTASLALLAKDVERGQMLAQIQQRRVNPPKVVSETFRDMLYAKHPLHRPTSGYQQTVSQLSRDDVVAFHQQFYVPNNVIVVMVGDLPEDKMVELLQRYLGGWQAGTSPPPVLPQPTPLQGKQVHIVDMDVNQSYLQFGHLGVRRADPEFAAIRAMNYMLGGGGFVSRLTRSIREEQGLAYSVFSEFVGGSQGPGFFVAGLQTRIDTTSQALNSLFTVLEGMKRQPVSPDELTDMKLYFEGSLPRRAETYGQVAELLVDREFFDLPDGYWESEIRRIQQLTAQDIQRLAQRYLDTENFVLALVSKRERLQLSVAAIPAEAIAYVPAP